MYILTDPNDIEEIKIYIGTKSKKISYFIREAAKNPFDNPLLPPFSGLSIKKRTFFCGIHKYICIMYILADMK